VSSVSGTTSSAEKHAAKAAALDAGKRLPDAVDLTNRQAAAEQPVIHLLQCSERHAGRKHLDQARGASRNQKQQLGVIRGTFQEADQGIAGGKTPVIRHRVTGFETGKPAIIRQSIPCPV
jgi:hypothetical protein